jgi:hypothetical protein
MDAQVEHTYLTYCSLSLDMRLDIVREAHIPLIFVPVRHIPAWLHIPPVVAGSE